MNDQDSNSAKGAEIDAVVAQANQLANMILLALRTSGFERFFAEGAEAWAQPEPDMTRIAAIAEKTDFNPRAVRAKRYLCAQLHRNIRGTAGTTFPYHKRADGQLWPFSKQDSHVYHKRELSMRGAFQRPSLPNALESVVRLCVSS